MTAKVHPSAVIGTGATLGRDVSIGPYCVVGDEVRLGDGVVLRSHVVVDGCTKIGAKTEIYPFASVGLPPQDMKYRGEASRLVIGERNVIREYVTMNPGTEGGGSLTEIGNDCLIMIGAHVAHDCKIGNFVIMVNNATLGGHVEIGDYAIIGGLSAVHQFVRIGPHAMVGGMSGVENDVIPYCSTIGDRARLSGLNVVGLRRREFSKEGIHQLRDAYRMLFAEKGTLKERIEDVAGMFADHAAVMDIVDFMRAESQRGLTQPKSGK
jgi:UDP-N-acetylglucosamine acyltransferase